MTLPCIFQAGPLLFTIFGQDIEHYLNSYIISLYNQFGFDILLKPRIIFCVTAEAIVSLDNDVDFELLVHFDIKTITINFFIRMANI